MYKCINGAMTFVGVYDDVLYMYSTNISAQNLKTGCRGIYTRAPYCKEPTVEWNIFENQNQFSTLMQTSY